MTSSLITAFRRFGIYLMFVVVAACDSFNGDFIESKKKVTFSHIEYYTLPGSSIVIDLKTSIKQAFSIVSLTISENPAKGMLVQMDSFLFKYTPHLDFVAGQDQFSLSGRLDDGTIVKSEPLLIYVKESAEEFPCGVHAIEDDVRLTTTDTTVIRILNNDRICPGPELDVFIRLEPRSGEVELTGDSIVYKPNSSIVGSDELVYGIRNADGDVVSYGLVSINEMKSFGVPVEMTEIFFIDNEIGFMAGGSSIFKTTDGGANWEELQYPEGEGEEHFFLNFNDIFFVDENVGFVAFSEHEFLVFPSTKCQGGWLMTTNGGLSWTRTNFETPVGSIVFASPLVGFIAISPCMGGGAIFRTVDGGNTWEQALSTTTYFGDINISLANENIGYVFEPQGIYVTKDGGTTWMYIAPDNHVTSLAVGGEDIVCASFNSAFSQTPGPGTIFRSEGGSPFMAVSDYFHWIVDLEFSPSGDLGIAVGIKEQPIYTESVPLMISKSTDKGRTWNDLPHLVFGYPIDISIPSEDVAYILCSDKIIKISL